jgi:hypothetical protein
MAEKTRATKHVVKSQLSSREVSLYEIGKSFSSDTGYQTHPKISHGKENGKANIIYRARMPSTGIKQRRGNSQLRKGRYLQTTIPKTMWSTLVESVSLGRCSMEKTTSRWNNLAPFFLHPRRRSNQWNRMFLSIFGYGEIRVWWLAFGTFRGNDCIDYCSYVWRLIVGRGDDSRWRRFSSFRLCQENTTALGSCDHDEDP